MSVNPLGGTIVSVGDRDPEGWHDVKRGNASWFTLFSSDMTPTADMRAGIMEIPANGGILEPHRHEQAEIYFVFEGTGTLTICGVATEVIPGVAAFIPGDAEHSLKNDSASPLRIFYVFSTDCFADVVYRFPNRHPDR